MNNNTNSLICPDCNTQLEKGQIRCNFCGLAVANFVDQIAGKDNIIKDNTIDDESVGIDPIEEEVSDMGDPALIGIPECKQDNSGIKQPIVENMDHNNGNGHKDSEELAGTQEVNAISEPSSIPPAQAQSSSIHPESMPNPESMPLPKKPGTMVLRIPEKDASRILRRTGNTDPLANGFLFRVEDQWLHEVTNLNEMEINGFCIGDVQDAMLNPEDTRSVHEILKTSRMKYKISLNGDGREGAVTLKQLQVEEKAQNKGAAIL